MKNKLNKTALLLVALLAALSSMQLFAIEYSNVPGISYSGSSAIIMNSSPSSIPTNFNNRYITDREFEGIDPINLSLSQKLIIPLSTSKTVVITSGVHHFEAKSTDEKIVVPSLSLLPLQATCIPISIGKATVTMTYPKENVDETKTLVINVISDDLE